ncbi:endonuclease/exonuclease/phosphatase family protein [Campylobacter sp. 19-13652]|uniref:endonuclease/exonuclease/phosphatase family protein n=1 Tax=Campylobacter sp. 19-13652 TaxID=2840180 RepID=UPI001C74BF81|nr:endonuclease/exonuclease/phosphatase family protein [Campylobacter sp. 19-13652]BCX79125.1 endonuclease [Campylobacter sp. 19-13652]
MRAVFAWLFLVACMFGAQLKIASFNVENLFDGREQGSEYKDFRYPKWNASLYEIKLAKIVSVLRELDADIIGLQEIENAQVLALLAKKAGYEYYYFSSTERAPVGIGILSRVPYVGVKEFSVPRFKTRNILQTIFFVDNVSFSVFNAHFPAYNHGKGKQASIEAKKTMSLAVRGAQNAIILGDFNSPYGSKFVLKNLIDYKGYTDLWKYIKDPKERYSHVAGASYRAIDHILLSDEFFKKNSGVWFEDFYVFKKQVVGAKDYSDHLPIVAVIKVGK